MADIKAIAVKSTNIHTCIGSMNKSMKEHLSY